MKCPKILCHKCGVMPIYKTEEKEYSHGHVGTVGWYVCPKCGQDSTTGEYWDENNIKKAINDMIKRNVKDKK